MRYIKGFFKLISIFVIIIICITIIKSSFIEPYRIPTGSMLPTLMIGDLIFVNKMSYGFKIPFSDITYGDMNHDPKYLFGQSNPKRGDVIVFKFPRDPSINYIKRVIAIPGDTVEIVEKVLYINGLEVSREHVNSRNFMNDMDEQYKDYDLRFFRERLALRKHYIQLDNDNYFKVNSKKITIPDDQFFVMGDNRDYSYDSRFWGLVPRKNIKGRAFLIWFSIILPVGENKGSTFKFRPWRILSLIN